MNKCSKISLTAVLEITLLSKCLFIDLFTILPNSNVWLYFSSLGFSIIFYYYFLLLDISSHIITFYFFSFLSYLSFFFKKKLRQIIRTFFQNSKIQFIWPERIKIKVNRSFLVVFLLVSRLSYGPSVVIIACGICTVLLKKTEPKEELRSPAFLSLPLLVILISFPCLFAFTVFT